MLNGDKTNWIFVGVIFEAYLDVIWCGGRSKGLHYL